MRKKNRGGGDNVWVVRRKLVCVVKGSEEILHLGGSTVAPSWWQVF